MARKIRMQNSEENRGGTSSTNVNYRIKDVRNPDLFKMTSLIVELFSSWLAVFADILVPLGMYGVRFASFASPSRSARAPCRTYYLPF